MLLFEVVRGGGGIKYIPLCQNLIPCSISFIQPCSQRRASAVVTLPQSIMLTNDSDMLICTASARFLLFHLTTSIPLTYDDGSFLGFK